MITWNEVLENREKWEAALVSGKFKQAKGVLNNRDTGGFCCLGVACEIIPSLKESAVPNETVLENSAEPDKLAGQTATTGYGELHEKYCAPHELVVLLGLIGAEGEDATHSSTLTRLNDDGMPFETIADRIKTGQFYITEDEWKFENVK